MCIALSFGGVCEELSPRIANTQTMKRSNLQVSGSEDLKELCSALEGEIAQAGETGFGPNPEDFQERTHKTEKNKNTQNTTERWETSSFNKIQKNTDIDDGG